MTTNKHKIRTSKFIAKVAIEAIKGEITASQLAGKYQIHPVTISQWKTEVEKRLYEIFEKKKKKKELAKEKLIEDLYTLVGKREVEIDWLKKKVDIFTS